MTTTFLQIDFNVLRGAYPSNSLLAQQGLNLGDIVSKLLPYLFIFAGLLLLVYLIWGGFGFMTSRGDAKALDQAKAKVTNAIIGFIVIFASYWLIQIIQIVFGLPRVL